MMKYGLAPLFRFGSATKNYQNYERSTDNIFGSMPVINLGKKIGSPNFGVTPFTTGPNSPFLSTVQCNNFDVDNGNLNTDPTAPSPYGNNLPVQIRTNLTNLENGYSDPITVPAKGSGDGPGSTVSVGMDPNDPSISGDLKSIRIRFQLSHQSNPPQWSDYFDVPNDGKHHYFPIPAGASGPFGDQPLDPLRPGKCYDVVIEKNSVGCPVVKIAVVDCPPVACKTIAIENQSDGGLGVTMTLTGSNGRAIGEPFQENITLSDSHTYTYAVPGIDHVGIQKATINYSGKDGKKTTLDVPDDGKIHEFKFDDGTCLRADIVHDPCIRLRVFRTPCACDLQISVQPITTKDGKLKDLDIYPFQLALRYQNLANTDSATIYSPSRTTIQNHRGGTAGPLVSITVTIPGTFDGIVVPDDGNPHPIRIRRHTTASAFFIKGGQVRPDLNIINKEDLELDCYYIAQILHNPCPVLSIKKICTGLPLPILHGI